MAEGVNDRFDFGAPVIAPADLGRVHFIAIGGSGMSGIAALLHDLGVAVSGCDSAASEALSALAARGIPATVGHDPAHIAGADSLVVSSAIREDNPELAAARERGLRILHRAQALASAMGADLRIAVAGANGKTTTSAMVVSALRGAGLDPSYVIGSQLADTGRNAMRGRDGIFVAEADESDGSFLSYHPQVAVVTNVQPDHLDFYGTFERVQAAYDDFAASIEPGGLVVAAHDDPGARALADRIRGAGGRVVTYGEGPGADVMMSGVRTAGLASGAQVRYGGTSLDLMVNAPGTHNVHNAVAALTAGWLGVGADPRRLAAGLATFPGTRRRFERRGSARGVTVVDDYAHNAPKVAAVVAGARATLGDSAALRVVFQPHLYSRTRDFADGFARALAGADQVVLLPIYGAREQPLEGVSSELIAQGLRALGRDVELASDPADAVARLTRHAREGDLILTVGAGDVTALGPMVLTALNEES